MKSYDWFIILFENKYLLNIYINYETVYTVILYSHLLQRTLKIITQFCILGYNGKFTICMKILLLFAAIV